MRAECLSKGADMKKFLAFVLAVIIAFVGGVVAAQFIDFSHFKKGDVKITEVTLKEEIKQVSELATLQNTITDIYTFEEEEIEFHGISIPFTDSKLEVLCSTIVKMGPVLEDAEISVNSAGTKATITLPHSTILSAEIDENSWQIQDQKNGLFNRVTVEDDDTLRKNIRSQIETKVDEEGLLTQADENAVSQLKTILESANPGLEVTVEFK